MALPQWLKDTIKFQKTLALFAHASNRHEAKAAELAARRVMAACNIDPVTIPNGAFTSHMNFKDNALLQKLRDEWCAAHPDYHYKTGRDRVVRRLKSKPRPVNTKPVNTKMYDGMFNDFQPEPVNTKAKAAPADGVNTRSTSDRNRDRHSPGYMRDYMRRRRAKPKPKR